MPGSLRKRGNSWGAQGLRRYRSGDRQTTLVSATVKGSRRAARQSLPSRFAR